MQICIKPPFSVMQPQIEKPGKKYLCNVPRSSDMKFHKIWYRGCGEMALDGWTNGHMDVCTAWRLHVSGSIKRTTHFGLHCKAMCLAKNKKSLSQYYIACPVIQIYSFITQFLLLTTLKRKAFKNIVEKGENAGIMLFLIFPFFYTNMCKDHWLSVNAFNSIVFYILMFDID